MNTTLEARFGSLNVVVFEYHLLLLGFRDLKSTECLKIVGVEVLMAEMFRNFEVIALFFLMLPLC